MHVIAVPTPSCTKTATVSLLALAVYLLPSSCATFWTQGVVPLYVWHQYHTHFWYDPMQPVHTEQDFDGTNEHLPPRGL